MDRLPKKVGSLFFLKKFKKSGFFLILSLLLSGRGRIERSDNMFDWDVIGFRLGVGALVASVAMICLFCMIGMIF